MTSADSSQVDPRFLANAMASFLQIGAVVVLLYLCLDIVSPFLSVLAWGLIIGVAMYPLHLSLTQRLGGRAKLSVTLLVLAGLAVLLVPTWYLAESTVGGLRTVAGDIQAGTISIPAPDQSVSEWPLVGERVFAAWTDLATNMQDALNRYSPQLQRVGQMALGAAGNAVVTVFQFIFSILIAGAFMLNAERGRRVAGEIAVSLMGTERGDQMAELSIATIRSVTKGVLGVAIIQTILAAIGFLLIGLPAAGLWAGVVLVLAIIQLPPLIVMGPIAIWAFSVMEGLPATIFLIYAIIVSGSDAFLKPMLLGRGVDVPMLVILIGAIGGAISQGIIGLFVGAVVLALGYQIVTAWMAPDEVLAEFAHDADEEDPRQ